jgi:hypothetical protein
MSLRNLIRLLAACTATVPVTLLTWKTTGPWPLLGGLAGLLLTVGYLALLSGKGDLTRWQLRYHLEPGADTERLEATLRYLVDRAGHVVLEASADGLFLELPQPLDRYIEAQLPRALPEIRLSRDDNGTRKAGRSFFLSVGPLSSDLLRWATEGEDREVRLHIRQTPFATLTVETDGRPSSGRWVRLPLPRRLKRIWHGLPIWDELSAGVRLSTLFPPTTDGSAYSSRSRLLQLVPPANYQPGGEGRRLGYSGDGRLLSLGRHIPQFTVGAPGSFLVQQSLQDLGRGRTVIVVSPHRRLLEQMARSTRETPTYWLDPQSSYRSAHLAIVTAEEWAHEDIQTVVQGTQTFLANLGLELHLPAVASFTDHLIRALAMTAQRTANDLPFTDLYLVSQSTQALRSFLAQAGDLAGDSGEELLTLLDEDAGYVQAVTILSTLRAALRPLAAGQIQSLCAEPFLNPSQALAQPSLLLVPMTDADFPENDCLLSAMLDLTLTRLLSRGEDFCLSLHLHEPHLYRTDGGQRWIDVARQDPRLSLLLDTQEAEAYPVREEEPRGEIVFRCTAALAARLVADWQLPISAAELMELPPNSAIARLHGMTVALKMSAE